MAMYNFDLKLGNKVVGHLRYEDDYWYFRYTEEFQALGLRPLITIDTPDVNVEIKSKYLWGCFEKRLPGEGYYRFLDEEHKAIALTKHYHTVCDPFVLVPAGRLV